MLCKMETNPKEVVMFLEASKAFDRVNHYVLFEKPIKRGIPMYIVRILIF